MPMSRTQDHHEGRGTTLSVVAVAVLQRTNNHKNSNNHNDNGAGNEQQIVSIRISALR